MINCSRERLEDKIKTFSTFGDTGNGGITRLCFTEPNLQARSEFCRRCEALGMEVKTDDMGNIYATKSGKEDIPAISLGSHLDSVVKGGNYDGVLGVLTALEAVETIITEAIETIHPITVVVWTNEEGSRFRPAMMSSGVIAGKFDQAAMMNVADEEGVSFEEALDASGYRGDTVNRFSADKYKAFLELHVEQGPVLEAESKDIGVVEGVLGMVNYEIKTRGQANHAGTTPMSMRKDALYAMVAIIQYLHDELDKLDSALVYTTGEFSGGPNVHTVIPDNVRITLDARHRDPEVIKQVVAVIKSLPEKIRGCSVSYREQWARNTIDFKREMIEAVEESVKILGYPYQKMYSGAGHDAQYIADMVPATMVFVPSDSGFSHCEEEHTSLEHCWKGANVLLQTLLTLDKK
ncbi:MAG: Zn-dependent hydrolase [Bacillota bacterium]|nr:Zn-dependent hydrolase [Bacillota bacterium]